MIRSYIHSPGASSFGGLRCGCVRGRGGCNHCRPQGAERFVFSVDITARQSETELPALVSPARLPSQGLKTLHDIRMIVSDTE